MPPHEFLSLVLPSGGWYFAASKKPTAKGFTHYPCSSVVQLAVKLQQIDAEGQDAYFACASYAQDSYIGSDGKKHYRTAENALLARSFWLDIDCGVEKAEQRDGYLDPQEATKRLMAFCKANKLPMPMVILSGGGLHCYWVLTADISKDMWITVARMLKELTTSGPVPLLADSSRTSDIASLLRPVGTTNRKPERNGARVQLAHRMVPIGFDAFKEAIGIAHQQLTPAHQQAIPAHIANRTALVTTLGSQALATITLDELKETLSFIDPDLPRSDWWPILGAIADAHGEGGRDLAREWSSGTLRAAPAARFNPSDFEQDYTSALSRSGGAGPRTGIGTVIHMAREAGWKGNPNTAEPGWLEQMNSNFAFIDSEALIYRLPYRKFIAPADLRTLYANKLVPVGSGKGSRLIDQGTLWLKNKERREHNRLVMRPDEPDVTADNCLNVWTGFAVEPLAGSGKPFMDLLKRLVPDTKARLYILLWLAHLVQHPGVKMFTALVMWSHQQGVGKNLLFECMSSIIGRHAIVITQADLARDFNGWAADKIFVIGDEVASEDRRQHADKLKGLITGTTIQLNEKYQPARGVENLINFIFLSNSPSALFMSDHDRRYHVVEVTADRLTAAEVYAFVKWRDNGGLAHLLYGLQQVELGKFNPKAPAPETDAKKQMIADNRSDLEDWAESLMQTGPAISFGRDLATATELGQRYALDSGNKAPSTKTVVNTFKVLGARTRSNQVRLGNGKKVRVLALARPAYWEKQPEASWAAEMLKQFVFSPASHVPHVP